MPFEIVRKDITNMQVDVIVNTANPRPERIHFVLTTDGTALNYESVSAAADSVRCAMPLQARGKDRTVENYRKRGR